nr:hypothetical protein [Anaerolineae bacterium]
MPEWLIPWLVAAVVIWPLYRVEGWIQKHIQGLGLLLTNNPKAAVLIYFLAMLPGVALHEFSQWLLAKILRVKVKKFELWPQQHGSQIRLGLVEIDKKTDSIRATLIGMVPLATGVAAIALIGGLRFNTDVLIQSLGSGDLPTIVQGFREFMSAPDFMLWFYLVFAIANAMLPEEHDRINWWLPIGVIAAITIFLLIMDLSILLQVFLVGPMAQLANWLSFSVVMALGIDLVMMALISLSEVIFSRILNREIEYKS